MILHFYQPPTQESEITKQILTSCYLPLLRMLVNKHEFGITLNISGSLITQLKQQDEYEFFELVKKILRKNISPIPKEQEPVSSTPTDATS